MYNIYLFVYLFLLIHGAVTVGLYFMSIPILYELHVFDSTDQEDIPGVLSIIELVIAGASAIIVSVDYFNVDLNGCSFERTDYTIIKPEEDEKKDDNKKDKKKIALIIFYAAFCLASGVFSYIRLYNLGFFHETNTCADTQWTTGCPTTRYTEYADKITDIQQCNFNAYGGKNRILTDRLLIDWSLKENYDANKRSELLSNVNAALQLPSVDGKCQVGTVNDTICIIGAEDLPKIHWCWYWGCDKICNERYNVNQTWLIMSIINTIVYLAIAIVFIIWVK